MRSTRRCLVTATLALALIPLGADAWNAPPAGPIPIAEVRERAETGDYMVIEGIVIGSKNGTYFEIEDATGRMLVAIPDYLIRKEGEPADDELIRVAGKYDRGKLDKSVEGLRVMTLWRGEANMGARGKAAAPAAASDTKAKAETDAKPSTAASEKSGAAKQGAEKPAEKSAGTTAAAAPPAAADSAKPTGQSASKEPNIYRPTGDAETVEKLARARREWLVATAALEEASSAYARALYAAGDGGQVDPALEARNDAAEDRVAAASRRIPPLVEEARRAGVSEDVLRLYIQMTSPGGN